MKKVLFVLLAVFLTACQGPYQHNVYQATGQRLCSEYNNSFSCVSPLKVWHETVYPKNDFNLKWGPDTYVPYQPMSLNRAIYGGM